MKTNEEYIQEYIQTRGLSENTYKNVKLILNYYSNFQEQTLHELIIEADTEEENRIRWKHRQLKKRLINYMNHLRNNMTYTSAKTYLKIVKAFYSHHEIEIHKLPKLNSTNSQIITPITYKDLPDKEIIQKALQISNTLMKALILFLVSTGMSKIDVLNLTISDFIQATYDYHQTNNLQEALLKLQKISDEVDIIPTFRARRQKTNKYFITFCTHEATTHIIHYLLHRHQQYPISQKQQLFKIEKHYYTIKFQEINNKLQLGKVGAYNRFRGHMLRKYHASNLEKAGMDRYKINVLQGKSNNSVDDVYFFEDESHLREEYLKYRHSLLILSKVKEITVYSEEVLKIKKENEMLKKQIKNIEKMQKELDKIKEWFIE